VGEVKTGGSEVPQRAGRQVDPQQRRTAEACVADINAVGHELHISHVNFTLGPVNRTLWLPPQAKRVPLEILKGEKELKNHLSFVFPLCRVPSRRRFAEPTHFRLPDSLIRLKSIFHSPTQIILTRKNWH